MEAKKKANRLISEKSPYLLQHAYNPVNWYPWGNEAFSIAKAEDKPIFLSIGYSTCHWCHVMERESFEDDEIASLLNQYFISIKVDREERPDIDTLYMNACLTMNNSGGWPLSCFLAPNKKPFFAGTYFPKNDTMYGIGFYSLLKRIHNIWENQRTDVLKSADSIVLHLDQEEKNFSIKPDRAISAFHQLKNSFDKNYGGFGTAPKFPSLQNLLFLMRYGLKEQEEYAFEMVRKTLDSMYEGGIYDHIGGGFCRYSTDREWLIPHFEKMMTDNALHIIAYSEASALLDKKYAKIAQSISKFCTSTMMDKTGGFYTATDADSEGIEGKYYVFSPEEVTQVLGEEAGKRYCNLYHITLEGNFEKKSIPNLIGSTMSDDDYQFAEQSNKKLLQYRGQRTPPFRDDKVLTLINGLMIAALAIEGRILHDNNLITTAQNCASFILSVLVKNERLLSRWRNGEAGIPANSDDYACLIWGFIELYESTFNPDWLQLAVKFTENLNLLFWDDKDGGYYLTGNDINDLPIRQKNIYDSALPSGNSIMALNLLRLSRLCANEKYEQGANQIFSLSASVLNHQPSSCCGLLCSMLFLEDGGTEVILSNGNGFESLQSSIPAFSPFLTVTVFGKGFEKIIDTCPYLNNYNFNESQANAYVCKNGSCLAPISSPEELEKNLQRKRV